MHNPYATSRGAVRDRGDTTHERVGKGGSRVGTEGLIAMRLPLCLEAWIEWLISIRRV